MTLKIGARELKVVVSPVLSQDGHMGSYYDGSQEIHVAAGLHEGQQEVAFLHELIHACCTFAGIEDEEKLTEEQFCTRIDNTLHMVLRQNGVWFSGHSDEQIPQPVRKKLLER